MQGNNEPTNVPALRPSYIEMPSMPAASQPATGGGGFPVGLYVKRYGLLGIVLLLLGAAAGFTSVIFSTPVYRARTVVELQGLGEGVLKGMSDSSSETNNINVATQIQLIQSGSFMRNVASRLMTAAVPPVNPSNDLISRLRSRIRPSSQDAMAVLQEGLQYAQSTFHVRPINGTRLIEIDCDSTHPEIAANFVNTLAAEYVEQANQTRSQSNQKAARWLTSMLEEARIHYEEAETKLNEFIRKSGSTFVGDARPLAEVKLQQLKADLSVIQADRMGKQSQYEMVKNSPVESLPDVLSDEVIRHHQSDLAALKQERASLLTSLTPEHYKVRKVDAQIALLQETLDREVSMVAQKIKNDYEAAMRKERLLSSAYAVQTGQILANADKTSEYNALKQELETAKQTHNTLLLQVNQVTNATASTVDSMRVVEAALPPGAPYKPRPSVNIMFGCMAGFALTIGIAFLRESLDTSVKYPGQAKRWLTLPELGAIPSTDIHHSTGSPRDRFPVPGLRRKRQIAAPRDSEVFDVFAVSPRNRELVAWTNHASPVTESFRSVLASLLHGDMRHKGAKTFLFTSPSPGDGKTTVVSNIGVALAESGRRVLLIDGDLRRPRLHELFEIDGSSADISLGSILTSPRPLDQYTKDELAVGTAMRDLYILPGSHSYERTQSLLHSDRLPQLLSELASSFDVILVDAPPVLAFADARLLARYVDRTVLVMRAGVTPHTKLMQSVQQLSDDGIAILGTILNDWKPTGSEMSSYFGYYANPRAGGDA